MRTLVVTPTYNEAENIAPFVSAVLEVAPSVEVLVVDDASPDGTGAIVDEIASREPRVHVIHRAAKLGLGTAYVQGFSWGLDQGFDQLFEMDADFSHAPGDLPRLIAALASADVVIGSRNIPGGGVEGWGLGRHVLSRGGSLYARKILAIGIRDLTSGFKGYTSKALRLLEIGTIESNGYSFQIETTYRALRRGLRIEEVPIVFVDRRAGHSKMNRRIFAEAVWMVWKLRIDAARAR
jgi:dolichol-phosphate mannosyltransferase